MKHESRLKNGTYRGYRVSVRLVRRGARKYQPRELTSPEDVYRFLRPIGDLDREAFYCLHLDNKQRVISCEEVSRGTLTEVVAHPREIYKAAILNSARGIIVAHNHPTGDPSPSDNDRELTKRLYFAGNLIGIDLVDSLIIGSESYYSAKESGDL